jgi:glycerophosphoryl diester phosphodiesterase
MISAQTKMQDGFDWQGHRGARGLLPENTIPSFLKALELSVKTLELDVAVSKDKKIIISHEPWMSEHICSKPDGSPVNGSEAMSLKIMEMTYDEIRKFDCGSRGNARFPEQKPMPVHKPSLSDMVAEVRNWCYERMLPLPRFNIEIKSRPEGDLTYTPSVQEFTEILLKEITEMKLSDRVCIQSFDVRPLQAIKEKWPDITLALLVENTESVRKNLKKLGFLPNIYSPNYTLIKTKDVSFLHRKGVKVIPWTVNTVAEMQRIKDMKVDGIITDYPNLISQVK